MMVAVAVSPSLRALFLARWVGDKVGDKRGSFTGP